MKIAILAPVYAPIKENEDYGGVEYFIKLLSTKLLHRGHEVTLFASKDSKLNSIRVVKTSIAGLGVNRSISLSVLSKFNKNDERFVQAELFSELNRQHRKFDLILNNAPNWFSVYSGLLLTKPMVTILHTTVVQEELRSLFHHVNQDFHLVGNSRSTTRIYEENGLSVEKTIYHGLDFDTITWSKISGTYLVFAGRLLPYKGVEIAIRIAKKSGMHLKIVGRIQDEEYFANIIKPQLSQQVEYLGFVSREELLEVFRGAFCFLQTSLVSESFGLTTLEALSTGTPVIGFDLGATPEIILHGKTGFILKNQSIQAACRRLQNIKKINRVDCRKQAEKFSADRMVSQYEAYFKKLIN